MNFYSPLRYPGGKGKIASFIKLICEKNGLTGGCYVEPYAGGASVALSLLFSEHVSKIVINDLDRSIYAFWYCVINQTDELCKLIHDTKIDISEWHKQREIQKRKEDVPLLDLAFSTFSQNRTNRSGIIKAGVIGGLKQDGKWLMDARYNKVDLIGRIKRIAMYRSRITLYGLDACELITSITPTLPKNSLIYFDPPYYLKGKDLYVNHYVHEDHVKIAKLIENIEGLSWLVSYDNHPEIVSLYNNFRQHIYSLNYSAASLPSQGQEVMVFSNNLIAPVLFDSLDRTAQLTLFD